VSATGSPSETDAGAVRPARDQVVWSVLAAIANDPASLVPILEEHDEPLLAFTAHRHILAVNAAGARFFGYGPHELEGRSTDEIIPARFRQPGAPPQPVTRDLTTVEIPSLRADGTERRTSWTFGSAPTPEGPVFVLVARDVAEAARELDVLRRNDSRYQSLLLASTAVVWVADPEGKLIERQAAWEEYTGQTWDEYRGEGWIKGVHPDDRAQVAHDWEVAMREGRDLYRTQGRVWSHRHQAWRAFQTRAMAVRGDDGRILEWVGSLTDVQDAVDAQERLRRREHDLETRFQAIYENALDGIVLTDDHLRVVDANPAAARILGRPRERLLGMSTAELMPPGDPALGIERVDQFRAAGTMTGEGSILLPDGTIRRAEFGAVANVSPGIHLSIFRDIEDRKRAEDTERFLDEASTLLAASLDYDETLSAVTRLAVPRIADWAAVDMLEGSGAFRRVAVAHVDPAKVHLAEELRGRQQPTLSDPTGVGAVVRTGKPELIEVVTEEILVAALAEHPDLLPIIRGLGLRSAMTVPLSARGKVIGAISFVSAESRRRYSQSDLAFAQELSRRATYAVENALFVRDLRQANRTKDLFLKRAEHLQATATQLVRADSLEAIVRAFESEEPRSPVSALAWSLYLRTGDRLDLVAATAALRQLAAEWKSFSISTSTPLARAAATGEALWFRDADEMNALFPSVPLDAGGLGRGARVALPLGPGGDCRGVIGVMFETSRAFDADEKAYLVAVAHLWDQALERARLAAAEKEAIQRALDAETLATRKKDEFLAMLGHELRNPLAPIVTATALLRVRGRATGREIDILERQARHLVRLVDDLLDISRITSGKLTLKRTPVAIAEVIAQAVESTSPLFEEKKVRLFCEASPPGRALIVEGDRDRLVQVVANVLVNAAKFTPQGRSVSVRAAQEGPLAFVTVSDEGQGIEPDLLPRVFDLFSQGKQPADRRNGGLGLGLAIAHSIVVAHGGTIDVKSPGAGRGTVVSIRLPTTVSASDDGHRADGSSELLTEATTRHRVLVVDDNQDSAELLAAFLNERGYECFVAGNAHEALSLSRKVLPDAAILDIGLPDLDGHQLARELRATLAGQAPKLIALSGYAQDSDKRVAFEAGFAAHLAKPVEMTKLTAKLRHLLDGLSASASALDEGNVLT
jgi:PAS domain S-box-containing protein